MLTDMSSWDHMTKLHNQFLLFDDANKGKPQSQYNSIFIMSLLTDMSAWDHMTLSYTIIFYCLMMITRVNPRVNTTVYSL